MNLENILNREVVLTFDSNDSDSVEFAEEVDRIYEFVKVTPTGVKDEPQLRFGQGKYIRGKEEIKTFLDLYAACKKPKARPNTKIKLEAFLGKR